MTNPIPTGERISDAELSRIIQMMAGLEPIRPSMAQCWAMVQEIRRLRSQHPPEPAPVLGEVDLPSAPHHGEAYRIYSAIPSTGDPVEDAPLANQVARKLFTYAYGLETEVARLRSVSAPKDNGEGHYCPPLRAYDDSRNQSDCPMCARAALTQGKGKGVDNG